jgi:hypothetical protein
MTAHRQWLELAAITPAFSPASAEATELAGHLETCDACTREVAAMGVDLAEVRAVRAGGGGYLRGRIRAAAIDEPVGFSPLVVVAILGLLLVAAVGATLTVGSLLFRSDTPLPPPDAAVPDLSAKPIAWQTEVVHLGADALDLRANGKALHASTNQLKVDGDRGSLDYWTLELAWPEAGLEQRINLYFKSDGRSWWIDQVQAYDAVGPQPKWAAFPRDRLAMTPLGQPFRGDLTVQGKGRAGPVDLHLENVVLSVTPQPSFVEPLGGGMVATRDPFAPGGELHCSGILQLTPILAEQELLARGYRLSWRFESSTGPNTGYAELRLHAPPVGWITSTAIGGDGELTVFVADPARPFGGPPATVPAECAATNGG